MDATPSLTCGSECNILRLHGLPYERTYSVGQDSQCLRPRRAREPCGPWKLNMFDALQDKFQRVFKTLRSEGVLNERAVDETLRDVRLALLEADVNYKVVKELLDRVRVRALGEEVRSRLSPAEEVVRIVRDELVQILGCDAAFLTYSKEYPTVFLLVGLQGSGKTTTAGKLALWLSKKRRRPMLVSTDVYRPASREQLAIIAKEIDIPYF